MVKSIQLEAFDHTTFEYYPGNKVLVKTTLLGCNTILALYKPGIFNDGRGYVQCPVLTISMNGTGYIPNGKFNLLDRLTGQAVSILNKEKDGIIRTDYINMFDMGRLPDKTIYRKELQSKSTTYIPQSQLEFGGIYEEDSGRQSIYLGNCHVYKCNSNCVYTHTNKCIEGDYYSKYVYGSKELIQAMHKGVQLSEKNLFNGIKIDTLYDISIPDLSISSNCIDSFANPRKFKKKIGISCIPEDARFIRIVPNSDDLTSTILIIKRSNKSDTMERSPIDLNADGVAVMMHLADQG